VGVVAAEDAPPNEDASSVENLDEEPGKLTIVAVFKKT